MSKRRCCIGFQDQDSNSHPRHNTAVRVPAGTEVYGSFRFVVVLRSVDKELLRSRTPRHLSNPNPTRKSFGYGESLQVKDFAKRFEEKDYKRRLGEYARQEETLFLQSIDCWAR